MTIGKLEIELVGKVSPRVGSAVLDVDEVLVIKVLSKVGSAVSVVDEDRPPHPHLHQSSRLLP
jgi:hypothetical protein